ncbi:46308_t:CDS:2, partial [Gigaspora margarita]
DPLLLNMNISNESSIRLPEYVASILPPNHDYYVNEIHQLPDYITAEGFLVNRFEVDLFVNIGSIEGAQQWLVDFEEVSKTMMPQTRCYQIQEKKVIFRQLRHCIHSDIVRQKQGNPSLKIPNSLRIRNTDCNATIHLRLKQWRLQTNYLLEINIKFIHNHVIDSAKALTSALYTYENSLYLLSNNEQELMQLLADRAINPDHGYVSNLFKQFRNNYPGEKNSTSMAFILCVVTNLMIRVHEKIPQSGKICYVDASASFELLNTSITLFYTSCIAGALLLGLIVTSNELETTLENRMNMLRSLLSQYAFFGHGPSTGPIAFLTDDSKHECNALGRCWPQSKKLLCIFHVLQTFWRWLHDTKHNIDKIHKIPIMNLMKDILYAAMEIEMMDTPYKHQGVVATKYQIGSLNFFPSLIPNNRIMADHLFYASLHTYMNNNQSNTNQATTEIGTNTIQADTKKVQITTAVNIDQVTTNMSMDQVTTGVSMDQIATDT